VTRECFANLGHKMWALLASYREGLRAVKWMRNREYLEYIQRYRLRMLARSLESVPYYRDIMRQRGIEADAIQSRCDIELFPLLTRRIIRSEFRSLISKGPLHCHLEHSYAVCVKRGTSFREESTSVTGRDWHSVACSA